MRSRESPLAGAHGCAVEEGTVLALEVQTHVLGPLENNVYGVTDDATGRWALIDPCLGGESILEELAPRADSADAIVVTHAHFDHIGTLEEARSQLRAPVCMHRDELDVLRLAEEQAAWFGGGNFERPRDPERFVADGSVIELGEGSLTVLETPGHSPGGISLYSEPDGFVITGDALFRDGIGRTDLPGANHELLIQSIRTKLFPLPDDTAVYPGHGPATTIGTEKRSNPFLT